MASVRLLWPSYCRSEGGRIRRYRGGDLLEVTDKEIQSHPGAFESIQRTSSVEKPKKRRRKPRSKSNGDHEA